MFWKYLVCATGAVALSSSIAVADGLDVAPPAAYTSLKDVPIVVAPWAGWYFGLHAGVVFDDEDNGKIRKEKFKKGELVKEEYPGKFDDFIFNNDDEEEHDFIGGVHLGYNWQRPGSPFVFGIEGDVDFSDRVDWLASIRGRLGWGTERALLYITGGVAFADNGNNNGFDVFARDEGDFVRVDRGNDDDDTEVGWVAGVGAEFKLAQNVSLGLEGLYYGFDSDDDDEIRFVETGAYPDEEFVFSRDGEENNFWQVRARLTYHINQAATPVAAASLF